jgi:hypothetical protein
MSHRIRILIGVLLAALAVYGMDDLSVSLDVPSRQLYSTLTIYRLYRVNEKFNKYYFETRPTVQQQCVNSLFPHSGTSPCWYLTRHTMQVTEVN